MLLPAELFILIVGLCDKSTLHHLLFVNSVFYTISSRQLYKVIDLPKIQAAGDLTAGLMTLAENQDLAALVQEFVLHTNEHRNRVYKYSSEALFELVLRALRNMVNLKYANVKNEYWQPIPSQFNCIFSALKTRSIVTLIVEVTFRKGILKHIVQLESLTELGLRGDLIDENALIEVLQDKTTFPNLRSVRALPETLKVFAKYRIMKKMGVEYCNGSLVGPAEEITEVFSERCPEILELRTILSLPEWLQLLNTLGLHGSTLKSHAVSVSWQFIEYDDDQIWGQIGTLLERLSELHYLSIMGDLTDKNKQIWQRLEKTCAESCPRLLSLWTPLGYLKRLSAADSWPAHHQSFSRCYPCVSAQAEFYLRPSECRCSNM